MDHEPAPVLKMWVAYDGTDFQGSQRQEGRRTVEGTLIEAVRPLAASSVRVTLAGRTDAGVHAIGQVASVSGIRPSLDASTVVAAVNASSPDDVTVIDAEWVDSAFHARFDARWREYRYRVWCGREQPLVRRMTWQRNASLDVATMNDAAQRLLGFCDLASFTGGGEGVPWSDRALRPRGTKRTIYRSSVREADAWWGIPAGNGLGIEFRIAADGFLPQVVRGMVGALVHIGQHRRSPSWIDDLIAARDRRLGPPTAPPQGLIFWRVGYGDEVPDPETIYALDRQ